MHAADVIYKSQKRDKVHFMKTLCQNEFSVIAICAMEMCFRSNIARTTSNIRIIPVGVFNGLRSQCIGTPHGADGI